MVRVFNPIYDTVFKYLMEDERVARILLGSILDKKITEISVLANDHTLPIGEDLKLLRIDFSAKFINEDNTEEFATIELQKSAEEEEIMRFRKYMSIHIGDEANAKKITKHHRNGEQYTVLKPLPIYCVYILGHTLGKGFEHAVMKTQIILKDQHGRVVTNNGQSDFVNAMLVNIAIVQIPHLPQKPLLHVEKILSIFDQRNKDKDKEIYVNIDDDNHDDNTEYQALVRRLLKGTADNQLRGDLDFEEEMLRKFERDRIDKNDLKYQIEETKKQLAEKDNTIIEQRNQLVAQQNQLAAMVRMSASLGASPEQIAATLNIPLSEVREILK